LTEALPVIHRASVTKKSDREPTLEDLAQMMAFDDQFQLLIGIKVGSDLPDLNQLAILFKRFMPPVSFAAASLNAFAAHCSKARADRERIREGD
jgi:hypothetical protein